MSVLFVMSYYNCLWVGVFVWIGWMVTLVVCLFWMFWGLVVLFGGYLFGVGFLFWLVLRFGLG